ncbi:MAG: hypothetical protein HY553_22905 [Elusimicrobia bacterium]|nr:hypothetical protein [Elusimicrobiota bacterium]
MRNEPRRVLCAISLLATVITPSWSQSLPFNGDAGRAFAQILQEVARQLPRDEQGRQRVPPREAPVPRPQEPAPPQTPAPERPRQEQPRQDPPRQDPPRREEPRHEHPRHEQPRRDDPPRRDDRRRDDRPRHDHPRPDYPRPGYPRPEYPRPDYPNYPVPDYPRDDRGTPYPDSPYYGGGIERLRAISRGIEESAARWRSAPSGSFEERIAQRRMEELMEEARALISSGRLSGESLSELEAYAKEAAAGWRRAPSGSTLERFYALAEQGAWDATIVALERRVRQAGDDYRGLEQLGLRYEEGWRRAPSGSREERFCGQAAQAAFDGALRALSSWLQYSRPSGYELERLGAEFDQRYRRAPSGSKAERFYRQAAETILQSMGSYRRPW